MTQESLIDNIILGYGGANAFTIYSQSIDENRQKTLNIVKKGVSVAGRVTGFKDNLIIDLLREERRWTIIGYIDSADKTKLESLWSAGGPSIMYLESVSYSVVIEKYNVKKLVEAQDERPIQITVVEGVDFA